MATKIELLSVSAKSAKLALYYVVTNPLASAKDQNRIAAGGLADTELQAFKDGTLHELVKSISITDMNKAEAKSRIEKVWAEREVEANRDYQRKYRDADFVGKVWNGSTWS